MGARSAEYAETYYAGNPGYYDTYCFKSIGRGTVPTWGDLGPLLNQDTGWLLEWPSAKASSDLSEVPNLESFRRSARPNAYVVASVPPDLAEELADEEAVALLGDVEDLTRRIP